LVLLRLGCVDQGGLMNDPIHVIGQLGVVKRQTQVMQNVVDSWQRYAGRAPLQGR
jgi:hypothetical protein